MSDETKNGQPAELSAEEQERLRQITEVLDRINNRFNSMDERFDRIEDKLKGMVDTTRSIRESIVDLQPPILRRARFKVIDGGDQGGSK
ncbi:hypothetical protein GXP70_27215 [Paenibacillus lycopersici]|uniref:t-SNARE coiled-coil homology domain-containing protein n=1 Tax=Paenibacillus lycopersici TaxID=2704462 RepID=A0A6C0G6K7_9BACL|nr:hypothetical protein [Paenibacillus lycopersici]QHT63290.1 hypothetical protein GXP70_27215 [Paenibacillus lycopersici]